MSNKNYRTSEKGNVLFLILIAVALFAALSYVVTQSTRSGSGSTEREQNILSSAQMTQYPTALRTALIRMVLAGTPIEHVAFNSTAPFYSSTIGRTEAAYVFSPKGGAAIYQEAPADLMTSGVATGWTFNANNRIPGIGLDDDGAGNEVIAFLSGVSNGVCKQVNEELGVNLAGCTLVAGVPNAGTVDVANGMNNTNASAYTFPSTGTAIVGAGCTTGLARQASGCFTNAAGTTFTFYSVLLER
jgi:hypothetical protein